MKYFISYVAYDMQHTLYHIGYGRSSWQKRDWTHFKAVLQDCLMSQAERFNQEEMDKFFAISRVNAEGEVDYKDLAYVITHGQSEDADEEGEEAPEA